MASRWNLGCVVHLAAMMGSPSRSPGLVMHFTSQKKIGTAHLNLCTLDTSLYMPLKMVGLPWRHSRLLAFSFWMKIRPVLTFFSKFANGFSIGFSPFPLVFH